MAIPTPGRDGRRSPAPPPRGNGGGRWSLLGASFAFGFAIAAIGLALDSLVLAAVLLIGLIAAVPPAPHRRFSKRAWLTAFALGGGLSLGMLAWRLLDRFV